MPECHKCRWNAEPPTDEKTAACLACRPSESLTNKGRYIVSIDSGEKAQTAAEVAASLQAARAEADADADEEAEPLDECCRRTAFAVFDFLSALNEREIKVLIEVAHGARLADIGRAGIIQLTNGETRPITRAAISAVWRRMVRKIPELDAVLKGGITPEIRAKIIERRKQHEAEEEQARGVSAQSD